MSLSKDLKNAHLSSPLSSISSDMNVSHLGSVTFTNLSGERETLLGLPEAQIIEIFGTDLAMLWASFEIELVLSLIIPTIPFCLTIPEIATSLAWFIIMVMSSFELKRTAAQARLFHLHIKLLATHVLPRPEEYSVHLPAIYHLTPYVPQGNPESSDSGKLWEESSRGGNAISWQGRN